jgi:hypothetical protein
MTMRERRDGYRIPLQLFLNEYVADRPHRCLTVNLSETGLYVHKLIQPLRRNTHVVGLEFELPGMGETIWARGEICYDDFDDYFHGSGIRITGIPRLHQHLLRDYINEKRRVRLEEIMRRIRLNRRH